MATRTNKTIRAAAKDKRVIAISAPVTITAGEGEGDKKGPAKFTSTFYTGGQMDIQGWDLPVVIDLAGLKPGKVLVANLDHEPSKRVGNFAVANDGKSLVANGTASAATAARDEVVNSAKDGYEWQSSLEVDPQKVEEVKPGKTAKANGQTFEGPLYITRVGVLKGFAFVSHGADDNTTVSIAASAASMKGKAMKAEVKAWAESMGIDTDSATPELVATIEANYEGKNGKKPAKIEASNPFEIRKIEAKRQNDIREIADKFIERRPNDIEFIEAVEKMVEHAIEAKMEARDFRAEMYEQSVPLAHTVPSPRSRDNQLTDQVIEAAIAKTGRLANIEKVFDARTLEAADKHFRDGISLSEIFYICAEANGYRGRRASRVSLEVQRAAFGAGPQGAIRAQGWSTISISNILSNNQNKFIREGWNAVDPTPLQLAAVRSVSDFREITTISLTGDLQFEKVGPAGEIKHGTLGDATTGNKAETYAKMLAITRQDIINDDLGALTAVPRRLGRGGALKLADIFWTEFLNPTTANFFHANNNNVNTGVADMTVGGLAATEAIFDAQTDPDGKPLALRPAIIVVPPALKAAAMTLMSSERLIDGTGTTIQGDINIWRGRFRVVSSPYMANSSYTGYSAVAWYMLADPNDLPMIEIVALNGRVEPTIDTADTDFNTLGVQFRGYSDIGVRVQETRAAVRADGGSS